MVFGGAAFLWPYISLFFARQNLDGVQIGILVSIGSGVALVFAPMWGRWSDRSPRPVRVVQVALLGSAVVYLVMGMHKAFGWLLLLAILIGIATCSIMPLSDSLVLEIADREHYGSIRLWGSVGWALMVVISGWLIEKTSILSAFYGYAAIMIGAALLLFLAPDRRAANDQDDAAKNQRGSIRALLSNRNLLALAGAACAWYFIDASIRNFEPLYISQLGAGESMIGLLNMLRALVEIPTMLWADRIARRHSPGLLILLALVIRALVSAVVVFFPTVPVIVTTRAIDGLANAFLFVGMVVFIGHYAPSGQRSFAITVISSTISNMMYLVNGPFSGWVFETFGGCWLYAIAAAGQLIGLGVFMAIRNGKTNR
jgi:PPP family 3-phenylpropionic acid transporter